MNNFYKENINKIVEGIQQIETNFLKRLENLIIATNLKKKKLIICGNGGSAATASHIAVDLTKNARIKTVNFNEYDLITCFANDFGYENWTKKAIELYGDKGDVLIAISSSGRSKNIINACKVAKKKNFSSIITLTGFNKNNPVKKNGNFNIWVNSDKYNYIENLHQTILLMIVDLMNK